MLALFAQRGKAAGPDADAAAAAAGGMACFGGFFLIYMLMFVIVIVGMWKVFTKAGQPGWAAIIPFYNLYVLVIEIAKKDIVWFLLSIFIPFAAIIPFMEVAKKFGKSEVYGIGLYFLPFIFFPMLGFGDARYQGRSRKPKYGDYDDDEDEEDEDDRPRKRRRARDDEDE